VINPVRPGGNLPGIQPSAAPSVARASFSSVLAASGVSTVSPAPVSGRAVVAEALNGQPNSVATMAEDAGVDPIWADRLDKMRTMVATNSIFAAANMPIVEKE